MPVISKADQMTMEERSIFLNEVHSLLVQVAAEREMHVDDLIYDFQEPDPIQTSAIDGKIVEYISLLLFLLLY